METITCKHYPWDNEKVKQGHELKNKSEVALQLLLKDNNKSPMQIAVVSSGWHKNSIKPKCSGCDIQKSQWVTLRDRDITGVNPSQIVLCVECLKAQVSGQSYEQQGQQGQQVQGHQYREHEQASPGNNMQCNLSQTPVNTKKDESRYLSEPVSLRANLRVRVALVNVWANSNYLDCQKIDGLFNTPLKGCKHIIDLISYQILEKGDKFTLQELLQAVHLLTLPLLELTLISASDATTDRYKEKTIASQYLLQFLDSTLDSMAINDEFEQVVIDFLNKSMSSCSSGDDDRRVFVVKLIYLLSACPKTPDIYRRASFNRFPTCSLINQESFEGYFSNNCSGFSLKMAIFK